MLREQPQPSPSSLPLQFQQIFKQSGCPATKISQLTSGVKLARAINKIFFDNGNPVLSNQIITQNEERKGNNVINMNMVLKQVKNNGKFQCPERIADLTTFKLIDNQEEMLAFVKWIVDCSRLGASGKGMRTGTSIEESKENMQRNIEVDGRTDPETYVIKNRRDLQSRIALQPHRPQEEKDYDHEDLEPLEEPEDKEQNIFENVYFCDRDISPQKVNIPLNDSLEMSDKVSKKGSFKVIRPKTRFDDGKKDEQNSDQKIDQIDSPGKDQNTTGYKNKLITTQVHDRYYSDEKESEARKTIPKMADRPPLYRKINKEQSKTQTQYKLDEEQQNFKVPAPFIPQNSTQSQSLRNSLKRKPNPQQTAPESKSPAPEMESRTNTLFKDINKIEQEIKRQNESRMRNTSVNRSVEGSRMKSTRKLFKIDIKEVSEQERKGIIEWLISINLLNSLATSYYDKFHQICKNGVIFPQIINHHQGRTGEIGYFKNPAKSAEIHSNYQKVFTCLKDLPGFESELLFMYQFFVPEVIENAFWSLLRSCQLCFQRTAPKKGKTYTRESEIKQKLSIKPQTEGNSRVKTQRNESFSKSIKKQTDTGEYQKLRYGTTNSFKTLSSRAQQPKNDTSKVLSVEKEQKSKRKGSLDFIKELPQKVNTVKHEELVQVEEPIQINKVGKGYKELHELKKSHNTSVNINTPQKKTDNSMSRSRIASTNSVKKLQEKPQMPSISLQMQMKALKYLKEKGHLAVTSLEPLPLFQDPIRNGILINKIINQELKLAYRYNLRPRNIVDCKDNFTKAFAQLKESLIPVPSAYEFYFENIIKGEMTLFYGLIWHITSLSPYRNMLGTNGLKNESAILSISKNYMNPQLDSTEKAAQQLLFWIRELQQQNPQIAQIKIRDLSHISTSIISNNLLYKIAHTLLPQTYTLKPTYENPISQMEQQSNIKKILSFLSHNKVLRSELAWKAKSLVKRDKGTTVEVLRELMGYYRKSRKGTAGLERENPVVSFVKFARQNSREEIKGYQRNNQRLETTLNNSYPAAPPKKQSIPKKKEQSPQIEIPWMRSLGFTGDLSLNSGVILCRLISKLTMKTLVCNENPTSKAECLTNIRKALKQVDKFKWDQEDIANADERTTEEIYRFIKEKYKHCYALKDLR